MADSEKVFWRYKISPPKTIALDGSFFNTQRMVLQYVTKAYLG